MIKVYLNYFLLNLVSLMLILLVVLVGIAFLTLLERKILGYVQMRKGPNKVGIMGIFQPFSDAIKLFSKEVFIIMKSNYLMYYICPLLMFFFMCSNWLTLYIIMNIYYLKYSMLMVVIILTLMGYMVLLMGWSSNSVYSMIGAMRVIAQTLSYEVSFILIVLSLMLFSESYSFHKFVNWQMYVWNFFSFMPLMLMFMISMLAELNRTPMDFIEGESELVSGFNIEYFSGNFALIFMAEYGMIIFYSYLMGFLFFNFSKSIFCLSIIINLIIIMIIMIRGLLPRMRYDELMYLCWKIILPFSLSYMIYILGIKFMMMSMV